MTNITLGKIGFVGGGNMAEAFIKGLLNGGVPAGELGFFEPNAERRTVIEERYGIKCAVDNGTLVSASDLVVLAIKPQMLDTVLAELAPAFDDSKLLVSILAGTTTARLEAGLGGMARVVRSMPNTPALVGQGAAALCVGHYATETDRQVAGRLFESVGAAVWVDEVQMDAVTGLSGSGPAFVYMFIEAMVAAGVQEGLSAEVARDLALQTVIGAAHMVRETGEGPDVLRDKVCSPGGTTIQGVGVLQDRDLRATVMAAIEAATRRSKELGQGK